MATIEDARRIALELPETWEKGAWGSATWRVGKAMFAWERPLRRKERDELGDRVPEGDILGVRVDDLGEKEAMIAQDPQLFFTVHHFDGYPAVLVRLQQIDEPRLREVIEDAWCARASAKLLAEFRDGHS